MMIDSHGNRLREEISHRKIIPFIGVYDVSSASIAARHPKPKTSFPAALIPCFEKDSWLRFGLIQQINALHIRVLPKMGKAFLFCRRTRSSCI